jgi:hypothetical protein
MPRRHLGYGTSEIGRLIEIVGRGDRWEVHRLRALYAWALIEAAQVVDAVRRVL